MSFQWNYFQLAEVKMDDSSCDNKTKSPEKKPVTMSVGSYASVLKGREKNKMSGEYNTPLILEVILNSSNLQTVLYSSRI